MRLCVGRLGCSRTPAGEEATQLSTCLTAGFCSSLCLDVRGRASGGARCQRWVVAQGGRAWAGFPGHTAERGGTRAHPSHLPIISMLDASGSFICFALRKNGLERICDCVRIDMAVVSCLVSRLSRLVWNQHTAPGSYVRADILTLRVRGPSAGGGARPVGRAGHRVRGASLGARCSPGSGRERRRCGRPEAVFVVA